jgi:hypothetical protein
MHQQFFLEYEVLTLNFQVIFTIKRLTTIPKGSTSQAYGDGNANLRRYSLITVVIQCVVNPRLQELRLVINTNVPFNIASYGLLLEIIAKVVNMVPDELIGNLGDTHLYLNHIEQAKQQINRDSFDLPKLNLNTEFWITESEECGVGPLSASGFVSSLADVYFCKCLLEGDIQLSNYQSHPSIKAPLSN